MDKSILSDVTHETYSGDRLKNQERIITKLFSLIGVSSVIVSSLDINEVLNSILEQTKILMECQLSSVLLVDPRTNQLYFGYLSKEEEKDSLKDVRLSKGEGIAGTVWEQGKSILVENAEKDNRFCDKADKKAETKTRSLIASPLIVQDKVIGVMEAINKTDETGFDKFDLQIFEALSNQAAIAIYNARLYEMAIKDGMTKLFIHRYFQERLSEEFQRASRYHRELSLIMFDLDHFKGINDTYGHQFGDEVLIKTADEIILHSRKSDIPARYGGEEFALILPEIGKEGAVAIAERIRSRIEGSEFQYEDKTVRVTISAGISSFKDHKPEDEAGIIRMADEALYQSKETGRNKVTFYEC